METFIRGLCPETYLHPIPKPRNEKSRNVAMLLRDGIGIANKDRGKGQLKHLPFSERLGDKQINSDASGCLEIIMHRQISSKIGNTTYERVYEEDPGGCVALLREAVNYSELRVFARAAGQWAISMLISERMKMLKRTG